MQVIPLCSIHSFIKGFNVQNRPWKVMATLKVLQVNLCCLRERKSHVRESSKKSLVKERQKACGTKAPRKYARPTYGAPPESFAKMIRKKSVSARKKLYR